jgi:phospholipase/carboxylesterase
MHHQFLLGIIAGLTDNGVADPQRIFLLGFSQTCALNFRFAFTHADILRGVIGMCGGMPGDWATSGIYRPTQAAVFYLYGTRDEFYPPERVAGYAAQLRARASQVTTREYDAPHDFTPAMRQDVRQWLQAQV